MQTRNLSWIAIPAFVFLIGPVSAHAAEVDCEANLSPSLEYFRLGDGTAHGTQVLTSVTMACKRGDLEGSLRSGYVAVSVNSNDATQKGSLNGITDSVLSMSYNLRPKRRQSLRLSTDLNIPTGLTDLSPTQRNALVDTDLVDFARYGEGWNVGVGINGAAPLSQRLSATLGAGYIYKGPYRPFKDEASLEPGAALTGTGGLVYTGKRSISKLTLSVYGQTETQRGGVRFYRPGTVGSVDFSQSFQLGAKTTVFGSATYSHSWSGVNYLPTATGSTAPAPIKAGETLAFSLGSQQKLSKVASVGVRASYINRGAESIDPVLLDFTPKREIYSFGAYGSVRVASQLELSANGFAKLIYDQPSNLYTRQSYKVLAIDIRITRRFK